MSANISDQPTKFAPRGLSRIEAAQYIGVSPGTFDKLVEEGAMPKPKHIRARRVWDRVEIDAAFTAMGDGADGEVNEWD